MRLYPYRLPSVKLGLLSVYFDFSQPLLLLPLRLLSLITRRPIPLLLPLPLTILLSAVLRPTVPATIPAYKVTPRGTIGVDVRLRAGTRTRVRRGRKRVHRLGLTPLRIDGGFKDRGADFILAGN